MTTRITSLITALFLSLSLALSACAPALVGVGTAAVAASSTEKGFSTSVADGVIKTKLSDKYFNYFCFWDHSNSKRDL